MSVGNFLKGKVKDIFGQGGKKFYVRDFRNAYQFRPDINPPRQQFQGYVNFTLNRNLYQAFFEESGQAFRSQLGSLVRRASLPNVDLRVETKNQYNRKKIVNTGVSYNPVTITVIDTINNEWITLLMKYYTYHYMNARNESDRQGSRDVGSADFMESIQEFANTKFGLSTSWKSNKAGYNVNSTPYFFERIDYVLYHGNKGVQYSLLRPVLTGFKTTDLDYAESGLMTFDLTFEYENFTMHQDLNFELSNFDVGRFEEANGFKGAAFDEGRKPLPLQKEAQKLEILGLSSATRNRSTQPQTQPVPPADEEINVDGARPPAQLPSSFGNAVAIPTGKDKKSNFLGGLLENVVDAGLSAAVNGTSIKNAVTGAALGGVLSVVEPALGNALVRGTQTPPAESTVPGPENPPVEPPPTE
jgi:hypothetical protein